MDKKKGLFYFKDLRKNVLLISLITCILFGHKVHYVLVGLTQSNPSYQSLNLPLHQLATVYMCSHSVSEAVSVLLRISEHFRNSAVPPKVAFFP